MRVVVVGCRENGDVDVDDHRSKIDQHREVPGRDRDLPSTHGVFEHDIADICALIFTTPAPGLRPDGANLNALVGVARPGRFGGDVSHLNLHKTFCIPHGGGGPSVGQSLCVLTSPSSCRGTRADKVARWFDGGSRTVRIGVDPARSPTYIAMTGRRGRRATLTAIASASFVARPRRRTTPFCSPVRRATGTRASWRTDASLDLRPLTATTGVTVDDVMTTGRLRFPRPTMSFPVAGTLMVEPTECENLAELDAFCDAMIAIRGEIDQVAAGGWPADDNRCEVLRTLPNVLSQNGITRIRGTGRVSDGLAFGCQAEGVARFAAHRRYYGDRNLVCSCPPIDAFAVTD